MFFQEKTMARTKTKSKKRPWERDYKIDTNFVASYMKVIFFGIVTIAIINCVLHHYFASQVSGFIAENGMQESMRPMYAELMAQQKELFNTVTLLTMGLGLIGMVLVGKTIKETVKRPIERMCAHFEKFPHLEGAKKIAVEDESLTELALAYNRLVMRHPDQYPNYKKDKVRNPYGY
jgi:hypothetical protein